MDKLGAFTERYNFAFDLKRQEKDFEFGNLNQRYKKGEMEDENLFKNFVFVNGWDSTNIWKL